MIKKYSSLAFKLSIFFTLIVFFVTTILTSLVFFEFNSKLTHQINLKISETAQHKINELKTTFEQEKNNLMLWRSSSVMQDVIIDDIDKRILTEIKLLKESYRISGEIYVFNEKNILIASTQSLDKKITMPNEWRHNNEDYHFSFKHTVDFIDYPVIAQSAKLTSSHLPINGRIVITHPWHDIENLLAPNQNMYALVYDNNATVELFKNEKSEIVQIDSYDTYTNTINIDNNQYLFAISEKIKFDEIDYRIVVFSPYTESQKLAHDLIDELILSACSVFLPMIILVTIISHRFVKPLKTLTAAVEKIQNSNDLSEHVVVHGHDEVANLGYAFNKMTSNLTDAFDKRSKVEKELADLNASLEKQIDDRTKDLQNALAQVKSAQSQLIQSEKMASLGQLVAGIAHEINNPVGSIYANMPVLKDYVCDLEETIKLAKNLSDEHGLETFKNHLQSIDYDFLSDDLEKLLNSQQSAAERIRNIVSALRNFSRLDQGEVKTVSLEEGIDSTLQMLHHEYKNRIEILKEYSLNTSVECYAGELNQVFMNIIANAIQAIQDSGTIKISTQKEDDNALIKISDTGHGISDKLKFKIFDPFFTTKDVGKGTGLGLSISYGIIQKHNGSLNVESEIGKGTTFVIKIPLKLNHIKD